MKRTELEAFLAVAENASFSAAARQLKLTQPAVSKRIASLELGLDATLFDRIGKRVALTPAGLALEREAGKVLAALQDAERAIADLAGAPAGRLRIATSHHIGLHRLAPILKRYAADYPAVQLDLRFEDSEDAHTLVAKGKVELAVVTLTASAAGGPEPGPQGLREECIWQDPLLFAVAPDHPLASLRNPSLASLAATPAILPGSKTYTGRIVSALFAAEGFTLEPTLETNYLETVRMLVQAGLGWSMLPACLTTDLHCLSLPQSARRLLGIVDDPQRSPSVAAQQFAATVRRFADPEPAANFSRRASSDSGHADAAADPSAR